MGTKISELPDAGALTGGDELIPIVQDGDTVKTTVQDIADYAGSGAVWGGITGDITDQTDLITAFNLKVDKVPGKGLSANDFTDILKTKLDGIEDGAQVNFTNTSDLINDGEDGVNPFITALDIPTSGQAGTLVREVKNMTGATLTKGTVVYISGANSNKPIVSKALAVSDALSSRTFGLLQSNISNNGVGYCVIIGDLSGLDTSAFTEGAQLYLSGTVAGTYTDTKTLAPTHLVYVGKVTRSHPILGQIEVQIQNGYELNEIHDVAISTPLNNQSLVYESATTLWKNKDLRVADVQTVGSSATVTAVSTNDIVTITAQAVGLTLANPTGTFSEGQSLIFRIKDSGTARSIAYGTNFRAIGVTAPTTTTANKTTYIGCIYNSTDTKFDIVGTCTEA